MLKSGCYSIIFLAFVLIAIKTAAQTKSIIWKFDSVTKIGSYSPVANGKPSAVKDAGYNAISFNGIDECLVIPNIPIVGCAEFTIQVLFKPAGDGPIEPRFMHFEDKEGIRGTLEIRLTKNKTWYLDAFLKNAKKKGLALIDSTQQYPADRWYWVAMVYDGKTMISYINGVKQLAGEIDFPHISDGSIAFGARLNQVNWFKGLISEARFYPEALNTTMLQKIEK